DWQSWVASFWFSGPEAAPKRSLPFGKGFTESQGQGIKLLSPALHLLKRPWPHPLIHPDRRDQGQARVGLGLHRFAGRLEQGCVSRKQIGNPGTGLLREFEKLCQLRADCRVLRRARQEQLDACRIGPRQTIVTSNFVTEAKQGTIEMKEARLALRLNQPRRAERILSFSPLPVLQRQASEVEFLIGSRVALVSHGNGLVGQLAA